MINLIVFKFNKITLKKARRNIGLSLLFFLLSTTIRAQEGIDSLIIDSEKFIFREFNETLDNISILELMDKYDQIPEGLQKARVDFVLSHYYSSIFDYSKSHYYVDKSREQYFKYKSWGNYVRVSKDLAMSLRDLGKTHLMEEVLLDAIAIANKEGVGHLILKPLHEIAIHYSYDLNDSHKAIEYGLEFLDTLEKYDSLGIKSEDFVYAKSVDTNIVYLEMGRSHIDIGQLVTGKVYLEKALAFFENDYEKSLRIYSHLIDWSIKSKQTNDATINYIKEYQNIVKKKREEEKSRLQIVSKELKTIELLENKLEKERLENQFLKRQRLIILIAFSIFCTLSIVLIVILKRYNSVQKKLNKKLADEKVLLRSIDRDRNMHLSIIAHELRTPIFTAKGLLDFFIINVDSNGETLKQIKSSINYLSYTIENILSMPVFKNNKIVQDELVIKEFYVIEYINEVINNYRYLASQKRIKIKLFAKDIPEGIKVLGIKQNIGQVLSNLLHNAIKFSPVNETVIISISKMKSAPKTLKLEFSVEDNGPGIKESSKSKIFQYRKKVILDKEKNTEKTEGLGIGLYIVQKILKTQNSSIFIESTPGNGAVFYFTLEFELALDEGKAKKKALRIENTSSKLNILIIDDNKLNALVAKKIVENLNHVGFSCTDEENFMQIIEKKSIDLVITDINMPKINGYEVSKLVKSSYNIPVLAHTAVSDISMRDQLVQESRLNGILVKPYTKKDLSQKLIELLH